MRRIGVFDVPSLVVKSFKGGVIYDGARVAVLLCGTVGKPKLSIDPSAPPEQIAAGSWEACCAWHRAAGFAPAAKGEKCPVIGATESRDDASAG